MYRRILLKLSGETLSGAGGHGLDPVAIRYVTDEIDSLLKSHPCELAIVIGAGNLFRGEKDGEALIMHQAIADSIGMLGTVMNALALQDAIKATGYSARVLSAIPAGTGYEEYKRSSALQYLANGTVVLCAGGTGNPFFTTDTTAVLRALELDCDVLLKGTKVDGVYDKDPNKHAEAKRFDTLTYAEALEKNLRVMDGAALSLGRDNNVKTIVFDFFTSGNLTKVVEDDSIGTTLVTVDL